MRFLFGVLLLPFVVLATSSAVIAETIGVNNLTQSSRDQLVRQAVSFFGGQSEWLRSNIRPPLDMNDFDRNRFMIELESSLTSTDMIWEPNSDVTLQVYFTGQLVSYDFDAGSYSVCVPRYMSSYTGFGADRPKIRFSFSPLYSSVTPDAPFGIDCNLSSELNPDFLNDASVLLRVPMSPEIGEAALNGSRTFRSGTILERGIVTFSFQCRLSSPGYMFGQSNLGSTDCNVQSANFNAGTVSVAMHDELNLISFEGEANGQTLRLEKGFWSILTVPAENRGIWWDFESVGTQEIVYRYIGRIYRTSYFMVTASEGVIVSSFVPWENE